MIDQLSTLTQAQGDFDWNIAWHPYPPDLKDASSVWNYNYSYDPNAADLVSFGNLQVLTSYMQTSGLLYNGAPRHLILTEEGFWCAPADYNNQSVLNNAAAAYAYSYYKVIAMNQAVAHNGGVPIDAYILYRGWDLPPNDSFGIWTQATNTPGVSNMPGVPKQPLYNVVQGIDRAGSFTVTAPLLQVIAQNKGTSLTSWSQLIPGLDQASFESTLLPPLSTAVAGAVALNNANLTTNLTTSSSMWQGTDFMVDLQNVTYNGQPNVLQSTFKLVFNQMTQKDYYGITYYPPGGALDLSKTPVLVLNVDATVANTNVNPTQFACMVRVYSGNNVIEGLTLGTLNQWNQLAFNLSGWSGLGSIDRIKVWYQPANGGVWTAATNSGIDSKLYIGALAATASNNVTITPVSQIPTGTNSNLALGKPVTVSSELTSSRGADMLTNGRTGWDPVNGDDFWTSVPNPSTNQWAYVDLGAPQSFNRIVVYPRLNDGLAFCFPSGFELQGSNDPNGTWDVLKPVTNFIPQPDGTGISFNVGEQTYRYVRFYATQLTHDQYNDYYAQFSELEIYNDSLALHQPVTVSSELTPSRGADMLTNGRTGWDPVNGDDFWTSVPNPSTNQWAYVDLGAPQSFNRIIVYPRLNDGLAFCFPTGFELQGTNDLNGTWNVLKSITNFIPQPDGTGISFNVGDQNYRYVRFYATQLTHDQYNDYYAQFSELEVDNC